MARKNPNQINRDPHVGRHITALTAATSLAAAAVLFAVSKRGGQEVNADAEAELGHAMRPTMARTAGEIVRFADKHPSLTRVNVGKKTVDVVVEGTMKSGALEGDNSTGAGLYLITRRQKGSTEPDPDAALSVTVGRWGQIGNDPNRVYSETISMQAPGNGVEGWSGLEDIRAQKADEPSSEPQLHIDTTRAEHPAAGARIIAEDTPGILEQAEVDLDPSLRFR